MLYKIILKSHKWRKKYIATQFAACESGELVISTIESTTYIIPAKVYISVKIKIVKNKEL